MTEMADQIEDQIITLLKLDSALDDVTFDREERAVIPNGYYPLLIVSVDQEEEVTQNIPTDAPETGLIKFLYTGHIAAETRSVDQLTKKDRILERGSKSTIRTLLDTCSNVFETYPRLNSLVYSGEIVRYVERVGPKTHGFLDRQNNLVNRGDFQFTVVTHKAGRGL